MKNATNSWMAGGAWVGMHIDRMPIFVLLFILQILGNAQSGLHGNFERRILKEDLLVSSKIDSVSVPQGHHVNKILDS